MKRRTTGRSRSEVYVADQVEFDVETFGGQTPHVILLPHIRNASYGGNDMKLEKRKGYGEKEE